jgi:hypothetical protein
MWAMLRLRLIQNTNFIESCNSRGGTAPGGIVATGSQAGLLSRADWPGSLRPACGLLAIGIVTARSSVDRQSQSRLKEMVVSAPEPALTPEAALLKSRQAVCAQTDAKNRVVLVALQPGNRGLFPAQ